MTESFQGRLYVLGQAACSVTLASALSGCFLWTTSGEGDQLQRELSQQNERIGQLERAQSDQLEQVRRAEAKAQQSITELEKVIERATSVVQRNSADVTVQVSELETKVAMLEGQIAEIQHAIEELKKAYVAAVNSGGQASSAASTSGGRDTVEIPNDKTDHYAAAYRAYSDRDFGKARSLFRAYIERYESDAQADNAQYWIGASYLVENRPATALAELRKVIERFRGGDAVDEALLDMAEAFYRLKACSDARTTLDTLIKTQPRSPLIKKAKQKLRDLRTPPRGACSS